MSNVLKIGTTLFFFLLLASSCQKDVLTEELTLTENASFQSNAIVADLDAEEDAIFSRSPRRGAGGVYVMDNDPAGNHLLAYARQADGSLDGPVSYETGGNGTGGGLGSQGSIITQGPYVFVVNAGSNEISVFFGTGSQLVLLDKVDSEGVMPTSLTFRDNTLYVLNAGGSGNIAGFRFQSQQLTYIPGSSQSLSSSSAAAAQVAFNPSGNILVVTERATNLITTYPVGPGGVAGPGTSYASAGATPFGFEFRYNGQLIVSEAAGGAPGASTSSSYNLSNAGVVTLVDGPEATNQTAACWLVVTNNGRYAYTTNTGSASVTGYQLNNFGLELLDGNGITGVTGAGPLDMDLSQGSKFLYTLNNGDDSISMFEVNQADGSLTHLGEVTGLPATALGLAAK